MPRTSKTCMLEKPNIVQENQIQWKISEVIVTTNEIYTAWNYFFQKPTKINQSKFILKKHIEEH